MITHSHCKKTRDKRQAVVSAEDVSKFETRAFAVKKQGGVENKGKRASVTDHVDVAGQPSWRPATIAELCAPKHSRRKIAAS
jgi:hypothetical protein